MRFQVLLSLWSVTSGLCIDKILEIAKTKVSKPKRFSLSNLRFCHAPLKRLINPPPMSTSRCGIICVMLPKCSAKKEGMVSVTAVVLKQSCQGEALCFYAKAKYIIYYVTNKETLNLEKHSIWPSESRCIHEDYLQQKSNAFYGWTFREPRRGCHSDFAMTIWCFWISDCMFWY